MKTGEMFSILNELADDVARFRRDASEVADDDLRLIYEQMAAHIQWMLEAIAERPGSLPGQAPWWPQFRDRRLRRDDGRT